MGEWGARLLWFGFGYLGAVATVLVAWLMVSVGALKLMKDKE